MKKYTKDWQFNVAYMVEIFYAFLIATYRTHWITVNDTEMYVYLLQCIEAKYNFRGAWNSHSYIPIAYTILFRRLYQLRLSCKASILFDLVLKNSSLQTS